MNITSVVSPAQGGRFTWGVGPSLVLSNGSHERITTNARATGPADAAVYNGKRRQLGLIVQNTWSFAGDGGRRDIVPMGLRALASDHVESGWYLSSSPSIAADWVADDGRKRGLLPVGGRIGRVLVIGGRRTSALVEACLHVLSPEVGPDRQSRLQASLLYPT